MKKAAVVIAVIIFMILVSSAIVDCTDESTIPYLSNKVLYLTPSPSPEVEAVIIEVPKVESDTVAVKGELPWWYGMTVPEWFDSENFDRDWILQELTIYHGLSMDAACGIVANLYFESQCEPNTWSDDGSYGICQWLGSRIVKMRNWCESNDFDPDSLSGQIEFMLYELDEYGIDLNQSAWDVASDMCLYYEKPYNAYYQSYIRATYAKELYEEKEN